METYRKEAKPILKKLAALKRERDAWKTLLASMTPAERKTYLAQEATKAAENAALSGVAIKEIETLKLIAVNMKFGEAVKFVLNAVEQAGKVVVFMSHHATIDRMMEALSHAEVKAASIDGRVQGPEREAIKDVFQDGDTQVLVCGIRAAGEGLTLTASHTVVFVEFDWNPGKHQQAEDRVHRIGQTEAPTIYYLVSMGTIEEKIAELIDSKREVVNAALGEGDRTVDEDGILDALLDRIVLLENAA
jgi:SNF2 family DNA or RNA helicase